MLDKCQKLPYNSNMNTKYISFMDLAEVSKYLGVSIHTVYRYLKDKENPLPAIYLTKRTIRVEKEELENWLENYRKEQS